MNSALNIPRNRSPQSRRGRLSQDSNMIKPGRANGFPPAERSQRSMILECVCLVLTGSLALSVSGAERPKPLDLTDLPLEALMNLDIPKVYAASKVEQKATEAPASITVITAEEVKKYGYRTLADLLESAPGFNVSYDRNYDFLGA